MIDLAQELLKLTEEMLKQARAQAWSEVEALQQQRGVLLSEIEEASGGLSANSEDVESLRALLEAIQSIEGECLRLAKAEKQLLAADHKQMSRGKAMKKAYGG